MEQYKQIKALSSSKLISGESSLKEPMFLGHRMFQIKDGEITNSFETNSNSAGSTDQIQQIILLPPNQNIHIQSFLPSKDRGFGSLDQKHKGSEKVTGQIATQLK